MVVLVYIPDFCGGDFNLHNPTGGRRARGERTEAERERANHRLYRGPLTTMPAAIRMSFYMDMEIEEASETLLFKNTL